MAVEMEEEVVVFVFGVIVLVVVIVDFDFDVVLVRALVPIHSTTLSWAHTAAEAVSKVEGCFTADTWGCVYQQHATTNNGRGLLQRNVHSVVLLQVTRGAANRQSLTCAAPTVDSRLAESS
jgi:hypothetical protein